MLDPSDFWALPARAVLPEPTLRQWLVPEQKFGKVHSDEKLALQITNGTNIRMTRIFGNYSCYSLIRPIRDFLKCQANMNHALVYYYDESGVSLTPVIPYGWQASAETEQLPSSRSKRLNILGFYTCNNQFEATTIEGSVNSECVIDCFDRFCAQTEKETVVIVDNAPTHTNRAFKARIPIWANKGMSVKYLPTYSPEMNIIEILWRFIKYQWLPLSAYQSYQQLKQELQNVLNGIGSKYLISFA